ncbi:MAG: DUF4199 domain-containing protein [Pseudomonadota bacterium]
MHRLALAYGLPAGAVPILLIIASTTFGEGGEFAGGHAFGYLVMLAALSLVFIGIKTHRDGALGGVISFRTGFLVGIAISAVAGLAYTVLWELYLAVTDHAFIGEYAAGLIEAKREAGVPDAKIEEFAAEMATMEARYANPLFRVPVTFMEIFPVGLIVTLVSAFLLKNERFLPARRGA